MPVMDGMEVLRALKGDSRFREIPVIVISASEELEQVIECIRLGAEDCLPKPFNADLLRARIESSLQRVVLRTKYLFDLWGDTVNTASRVETHGIPGAVCVSGAAWRQIADACRGESRGLVEVKGKGQLELVRVDAAAGWRRGSPLRLARSRGVHWSRERPGAWPRCAKRRQVHGCERLRGGQGS